MPPLSPAALAIPPSGIRAITERAVAMPGCLRLEIGEPGFDTPPHIVEAAAAAAREGWTRYTAGQGIASLRSAIAAKLARVNGLAVPPERIVVTNGAMSGLFTTFAALLAPGDEVLVPDPGWPNWEMMIRLVGGVPVRYPLDPARGFVPDAAAVEAAIGGRTRVLLVNSPANPTGAVFPPETLAALVDLAARHDLWVVSDECYDEITFDVPHVSTARFDRDGRVVSVFSCSKTYAMTGWRVGYVAAPPAAIGVIAKLQQPVLANVCAVAQKAAEAALTGPQEAVAAMRAHYRARRDQALALLGEAGVAGYRPQGAFYLMVDVGRPSVAFADELLTRQGIAVAPGAAFGEMARDFVRIALCVAADDLAKGLAALLAMRG